MTVKKLEDAKLAMDAILVEFEELCEEGRISPITIDSIAKHRIKFLKTADDLYVAMFFNMADTGVQVLRKSGKITDMNNKA